MADCIHDLGGVSCDACDEARDAFRREQALKEALEVAKVALEDLEAASRIVGIRYRSRDLLERLLARHGVSHG
jgi:hypothetical protein